MNIMKIIPEENNFTGYICKLQYDQTDELLSYPLRTETGYGKLTIPTNLTNNEINSLSQLIKSLINSHKRQSISEEK